MNAPLPFSLLPLPAQRAVHHYMTVDGCRPDFAEELLFIPGEMPASEMKARCWDAPDDVAGHPVRPRRHRGRLAPLTLVSA